VHLPWGEKGYLPVRLQEAGELPKTQQPVGRDVPIAPPSVAPIERMLDRLQGLSNAGSVPEGQNENSPQE